MFDEHKRLEKKLRKNGARAMADVTTAHKTFEEGTTDGLEVGLDPSRTLKWHYRFDVRVAPQQGSPFEASFHGSTRHPVQVGDQLPVLYDPHDHDKICIDHEHLDEVTAGTGIRIQVVSREDGSIRTVHAGEEISAGGRTIQVNSGGGIRITSSSTATSSATTSGPGDMDRIEALERLAALHEKGALTDAEFAAQKAKLLGE
jgi:hypothetical protein